jgi:4-amino-4-deoxy-L-arabinose transferase-like glycosyltransferase
LPRGLALIVAAALLARMAYAWETREAPTVRHLIGDAAGYYEWAQRIAGGDWVGSEGFYQAPLYPYLLGILFAAFGADIWAVRVVQAVWGAAACGFLCLGTWSFFGRRAGLVAGWMLALYGPAIYFDGMVQKASLTGVLTCALIAAVAGAGRTVAWHSLPVVGILAGLLSITRENALVWIAVLLVWAARMTNGEWRIANDGWSAKRAASAVLGLLLGVGLALFPVAVRNRVVSGEWSVSTFQAGPNFYIGNHRGADGRYQPLVRGHETPVFERRDATDLAQHAMGRPLSQREVSRFWVRKTWSEIRSDWSAWLRLMGLKLLMVLNRYEVADVESLYVYRDSSVVLSVLSRVWHFGVLLPLAAFGMVRTWGERKHLWVLHLMIATMLGAVAAFYVLGRYRYPIAILLMPFAAAGLVRVWDAARETQKRRNAESQRDEAARQQGREARRDQYRDRQGAGKLALIVAAVVAVIANAPVQNERRLNAMAWMNAGVALAQAGDLPSAERYFGGAVAEHPASAEGHNNLAQALALRGAFTEAIEHYQAVLAIEPELVGVHYNLGVALESTGRKTEALRAYLRAIELDAKDAPAEAAAARLRAGLDAP